MYSDLLASIRRQTRCIDLANEVLHEALMRYVLIPDRETIFRPQAYLSTVVRSVLVDHTREAARFVRVDPSIAPDGFLEDATGSAPSAEHLIDLHQRLVLAQQVIARLPPRCREVFWMFRIDGLPQAQIAQLLGISVNMVERHVLRAMLDLRAVREQLRS